MSKSNLITKIMFAVCLTVGVASVTSYAQKNPPPVTAAPRSPKVLMVAQPAHARFRITLNGFHVNHETNDDVLGLDGAGDEIFNALAFFMVDTNENTRSNLEFGYGADSLLIRNMHTGSDYPNREALAQHVGVPSAGAGIPGTYVARELTAYSNAVVIVPSIFEKDNDDRSLWNEFIASLRTAQPEISRAVRSIIVGASANQFRHSSLDFLRTFVTLTPGAFGIGPKTRPVGMVKVGDKLNYRPEILVFTYAAAEEAARTDYGQGRGIIEVKYDEDQSLAGSYVLYIQIEKIN